MSQPPRWPAEGHRYRTDAPVDDDGYPRPPAEAGYRPPQPRQETSAGHRSWYDPDLPDHRPAGRHYRESGYDESAHGLAYDAESGFAGRYDPGFGYGMHEHRANPEWGYRGYDDGRSQPYGPQAEPAYGSHPEPYRPQAEPVYGSHPEPTGDAYPTAAYRRVNQRPSRRDERSERSRRRSRPLLALLAILLVLAVGAGTAAVILRVGPLDDAAPTRLAAPDTLAGRPKITDGELQALADELVTTIRRNVPEATDTVGAFYGNPAKKDMIMLAGASGRVSDPAGQLDRALREMAAGGLAVRAAADADPGPLGGVARCGDATADGVPMGVCAWSDRGSLVLVVVYFTDGRRATAELAGIRAAVERRD